MASIFRSWTYKQAVDALGETNRGTVGEAGFKANRLYAELGDHWQGGDAWPLGAQLHAGIRKKMLDAIEPMFRPLDVINEVLDNVANGLLDQEPEVTFVPREPAKPESTAAQAQADAVAAMKARISSWWDQHRFWEQARQAVRRSRWAGRGALRLWISPDTYVVQRDQATGEVLSTALPKDLGFDDALAAVHVMAPPPETGLVYVDPNTRQRCGIFFFAVGTSPSDTNPKKYAELWFVDGEETIVRIIPESGTDAQEFPRAIARRLPIAQMEARLLITEPVRRQQRSLDVIETLLMRVIESAGFPERYTTNAMPSGVWLETPPADGPPLEVKEVEIGGQMRTWYLHQVPRVLGPMITTDLKGIVGQSGTTGGDVIMQPGVTFKDPTDPEYLTKASNHGRQTMLRECKQGHLASDSTAESSGLAYQQARAVFGKDLRATKSPLEGMVRDIIEATIAFAESMSGVTPGAGDSFLANYRCVVNLHVDAGPTSSLELAEYREQNKAGLLSRESAMARAGVEDIDAEIEALTRDPIALAALRKAQGDAMAALQKGGATFVGSAKAIGLSQEEADQLTAPDAPHPGTTP
jgi:hypothetical protein